MKTIFPLLLSALLLPCAAVAQSPSSAYHPTAPTGFVDLGLPSGTLWAPFNVGASRPSEPGDRFAWGEVEPKAEYEWDNYKWSTVQLDTARITKYAYDQWAVPDGAQCDDITALSPQDDAASQAWGPVWSTPSADDWAELWEHCVFSPDTLCGVVGFTITGSNESSIFLPATDGARANYWASDLPKPSHSNSYRAQEFEFSLADSMTYIYMGERDRRNGFAIRPVIRRFVWDGSFSYSTCKNTLTVKSDVFRDGVVTVDGVDHQFEGSFSTNLSDGVHNFLLTVRSGGLSLSSEVKTCYIVNQVEVKQSVDLGLSVNWAAFNLGAVKPSEFGDYYAWGECVPRSLLPDSYTADTKNFICSGDAATVAWGQEWRMPTHAEWIELKYKCDWTWGESDGVKGYFIRSKDKRYTDVLFLPAAGLMMGTLVDGCNSAGRYWSDHPSSGDKQRRQSALSLSFTSNDIYAADDKPSHLGFSIRPVCPRTAKDKQDKAEKKEKAAKNEKPRFTREWDW